MIAALHFVSQAEQAGQAVVITSWVELLTLLALGSAIGGAWHHIACHQEGCHRLGRFTHGHYKLCHIHHPGVPNDGKVRAEHIAKVSQASSEKTGRG